MFKNKTVSLVLSGGGACGIAHVGVLKALEEYGIVPDFIAGTSMGALVGGLYATGKSATEIYELLRSLKIMQTFDFNPLALTSTHFVGGKKVEKILMRETAEIDVKDCKTKFCATAVDLRTGKEFRFYDGPLWLAIRASISVPMAFKPVEYEGMYLVDGGVLNNVPVDIAQKEEKDIIIVCDVLNKYYFYKEPRSWVSIMEYSFNLLQNKYNKLKSSSYDYLIAPEIEKISPFMFLPKYVIELYEIGYKAGIRKAKKIVKDFNEQKLRTHIK